MTDEQKIVISSNEEKNFDKQIRPNLFDDFIGQSSIVKSLKTYITAAKQREEALDHILLYGPPGLGKTTLSNIVFPNPGGPYKRIWSNASSLCFAAVILSLIHI